MIEIENNQFNHRERTRWQAISTEFALVLGAFVLGTSEFASMGLLSELAQDSHTNMSAAGDYISDYAIGVVVGAPFIAMIAARTPRRALLVCLLALCAVGNALSATLSSFDMLVSARFISGLPHGAYFGVAALVAATLAHPGKRAQAVARVMMGLSLANLVGAPVGTWIGEFATWRATYLLLALLAAMAALICAGAVPVVHAAHGASARRELGALAKPQAWLTLGMGAIGLGGLFSVYTYLGSALVSVTGMAPSSIPLMLAVIGLGMFAGNFFGGWLADRGVMRAIGIVLVFNVATFAAFYFTFHSVLGVTVNVFLAGVASIALVPPLQTRLMDVAGHAQSLGAMLNGCAINVANALGATLAGLAITSRMGPVSIGPVGAGLALGGLVIFVVAAAWESLGKRERVA